MPSLLYRFIRWLVWGGKKRTSYQQYLKSEAWRRKKAEYYAVYPRRCVICSRKRYIQLHHVTYARLGRERLSDLKALCKYCHYAVHHTNLYPHLKPSRSKKK